MGRKKINLECLPVSFQSFEGLKKVALKAGYCRISFSRKNRLREQDVDNIIMLILEMLKRGFYDHKPYKLCLIPKVKHFQKIDPYWCEYLGVYGIATRGLSISSLEDRIIHQAVRYEIEPHMEKEFLENSYGYRSNKNKVKKKNVQTAIEKIEEYIEEGYIFIIDEDVSRCFDSIDHVRLMNLLKVSGFCTRELMKLIVAAIQAPRDKSGKLNHIGVPQGSPLGPLLCNWYLHHYIDIHLEGKVKWVRYADDIIMMCKSQTDAVNARLLLEKLVRRAGLTMKSKSRRKSRSYNDPLNYLGFRIDPSNNTITPPIDIIGNAARNVSYALMYGKKYMTHEEQRERIDQVSRSIVSYYKGYMDKDLIREFTDKMDLIKQSVITEF